MEEDINIEREHLIYQVAKRTELLNEVRTAYLRDVLSVKAYLKENNITSISMDYESILQSIPSLNISSLLPLFRPVSCVLDFIPCETCGGRVELIHKNEEALYAAQKESKEAQHQASKLRQENESLTKEKNLLEVRLGHRLQSFERALAQHKLQNARVAKDNEILEKKLETRVCNEMKAKKANAELMKKIKEKTVHQVQLLTKQACRERERRREQGRIIRSLEQQVQLTAETNANLQNQIQEINTAKEQAAVEAAAILEKEILKREEQIRNLNAVIADIATDYKSLKQEVREELSRAADVYEQRSQAISNEYVAAAAVISSLRRQLGEKNTEVDALAVTISGLESDLDLTTEKCKRLNVSLNKLMYENEQLEVEMKKEVAEMELSFHKKASAQHQREQLRLVLSRIQNRVFNRALRRWTWVIQQQIDHAKTREFNKAIRSRESEKTELLLELRKEKQALQKLELDHVLLERDKEKIEATILVQKEEKLAMLNELQEVKKGPPRAHKATQTAAKQLQRALVPRSQSSQTTLDIQKLLEDSIKGYRSQGVQCNDESKARRLELDERLVMTLEDALLHLFKDYEILKVKHYRTRSKSKQAIADARDKYRNEKHEHSFTRETLRQSEKQGHSISCQLESERRRCDRYQEVIQNMVEAMEKQQQEQQLQLHRAVRRHSSNLPFVTIYKEMAASYLQYFWRSRAKRRNMRQRRANPAQVGSFMKKNLHAIAKKNALRIGLMKIRDCQACNVELIPFGLQVNLVASDEELRAQLLRESEIASRMLKKRLMNPRHFTHLNNPSQLKLGK